MNKKKPRRWVKLEGSDVRLEYPMKKIMHEDGVHFHYEDDRSQPPKRVPMPPILFEDNGDGTYTQWTFGLFGPVGHCGQLLPNTQVVPLQTKRDFAEAKRLDERMAASLRSQTAFVCSMSGGRLTPDQLGQSTEE